MQIWNLGGQQPPRRDRLTMDATQGAAQRSGNERRDPLLLPMQPQGIAVLVAHWPWRSWGCEWAHQVSQFQMLTERVPILLSSPEAEMLKTLPNHATCGIERSPRLSNNFSTMQRDRRCIFAHPQDSQVRDTLQVDAPCQPCKRRLLAFHRGYMPHSVPNHSPTPSARRPRLDGGFETEEPLHGPGVVFWFLGPLHVDRYTSHETFSRHFHPCAHITLWLKVSHDVSRASTFSLTSICSVS